MALAPRIPRSVPRAAPRKRAGDDKNYLAFLRTLPCLICAFECNGNMGPMNAHHLRASVDGLPTGASRRAEDRWALPLCERHHLANYGRDTAHGAGNDEEWLIDRGFRDPRGLCETLWSIWRNTDVDERHAAALRAVQRARKVRRV